MKRSIFLTLVLYLFFFSNGYGAISLKLTLDKPVAALTDTIIMKVRIDGAAKGALPNIQGLDSFDVSNGGTSTVFKMINGQSSYGIDYTYYLYPLKKGKFRIGPAVVNIDGKTYKSNKVTLVLTDDKEKGAHLERGPLFMEAFISKQDLYVNQQALYTLKLYRRVRIADLSLDMPEVGGLIIEQMAEPKRYSVTLDSKKYEVIEIKYILMPARAGSLSIPPAKMNMVVQQQQNWPNSFFQDPFFGFNAGKPVSLQSNSIQLDVKALPEVSKPDNFSGLVGAFDMNCELEPREISVNDSATYTIKVAGSGNIRQIPDLKIKAVDGLKMYQDKPVLDIKKEDERITGIKTMKWAIVPERSGKFQIPELSLWFFDPEQKIFKELKAGPTSIISTARSQKEKSELKVLPEGNNQTAIIARPKKNKKEVVQVGKDIFPIHTSESSIKGVWIFRYANMALIIILICPPVLCLGLFIAKRLTYKNNNSKLMTKSKNALKIFIKKNNHKNMNPEEIHNAALEYLNNKFLLEGGYLTRDEAVCLLVKRGVSENTSKKFETCLKEIEAVIFSGTKNKNLHKIQIEFAAIVKSIEKEIR